MENAYAFMANCAKIAGFHRYPDDDVLEARLLAGDLVLPYEVGHVLQEAFRSVVVGHLVNLGVDDGVS